MRSKQHGELFISGHHAIAIRLTIRSGEFTYSACNDVGGDGIQSAMIQSLACIQFGLYRRKQDMSRRGRVIQDGQA
jgi:hypothetical protein